MWKDYTHFICDPDCNNINKNECKCNVTGERLFTYNDIYIFNNLRQKVQPYFHNVVCNKEYRKRLIYMIFPEDK